MLVEEFLVAVISLLTGVFNLYSRVKTSILVLDQDFAPKTDHIPFFRVENAGFDLVAQRRLIEYNDLPQVKAEQCEYLSLPHSKEPLGDFQPERVPFVKKEKLAAERNYHLSGERNRVARKYSHSFPTVETSDAYLFRIEGGGTPKTTFEES